MIKGTGDTRYAFVNGIIRAREARLLTRSHFDRLVAVDYTSFNTILSDTPYGVSGDFIGALDAEERLLRSFFNRFCLTDEVKNLVDWPEQMHNLKVRLKGGQNDLMYVQQSDAVESWPEVADEVLRFAVEKNPFVLSTNLDRILCRYLYDTALFTPFFEGYYRTYFDLENIRSFFRAKQFDDKRNIMNQVYIPSGRLNVDLLIDNMDVRQDQLGRNFFNTPYASIVEKGGAYYEDKNSFLRLERLCEEYRLGYLLQARRLTFGVEPLFAYFMFKTSEITKLRQVYWGKLNEVSVEDLRESVPDVW
ncbi:MAG: V-type ATPase subunit [candidate division WOR-3 bacterium]|nr:MAG: V-type ATPase subunit [candidate division WOR-3 bacterium]